MFLRVNNFLFVLFNDIDRQIKYNLDFFEMTFILIRLFFLNFLYYIFIYIIFNLTIKINSFTCVNC